MASCTLPSCDSLDGFFHFAVMFLLLLSIPANVMIRQCLNRRIDTVRAEVAAWQASRDRIQAKVNWQFTIDDARVKLKRLYPTFYE